MILLYQINPSYIHFFPVLILALVSVNTIGEKFSMFRNITKEMVAHIRRTNKKTIGFFTIFNFLKSMIFLLTHSVAKALKAIVRVFEVVLICLL